MKRIAAVALALLLAALALAALAEGEATIAIRYGHNVAAYEKPDPHSRFVGWALMSAHYPALETVEGYRGKGERNPNWILIPLEDGTKGYIPERMTSPVIDNAEEIAERHVIVHHQGSIHLHRLPTMDSQMMGWAWKGTVYPVIGEAVRGWWPIALTDGTTGYVSGEMAHEYDEAEDGKARRVHIVKRAAVREWPRSDSRLLTGIGPDAVLPCVHVCDNGWYEVQTEPGAYGFIHPSVAELIEEE